MNLTTKNIIIILLLVLLAGAGFYIYTNQNSVSEEENQNEEISEENTTSENEENEESTEEDEESTEVESNDEDDVSESSNESASNEIENFFAFEELEVGKTLNGLEITSLEPVVERDDFPMERYNASIIFSGENLISGSYEYYPEDSDAMGIFSNVICFTVDANTVLKLPQFEQTESDFEFRNLFCFNDTEEAASMMNIEPGDSGFAALTIDNYNYVSLESAVVNTADLVSVQEVSDEPVPAESL